MFSCTTTHVNLLNTQSNGTVGIIQVRAARHTGTGDRMSCHRRCIGGGRCRSTFHHDKRSRR